MPQRLAGRKGLYDKRGVRSDCKAITQDGQKQKNNFVWSGSARYATHDLHAGNSISEYTGTDLAKITFDIQLLASLGVDPMSEIWRLFDLERQGVTLPLTIGNHGYGRYRWTILSHKTKAEHYDGHGNIISATLSISLQEYLR